MLNRFATSVIICILIICLSFVSGQVFQSGIVHLTSNGSIGTYTLNYVNATNDLIVSIASFSAINQSTGCYIANRTAIQAQLACSGNIIMVAYLFYQRTPLIYSNGFSYYFFQGNSNYSALWKAPVQMTLIQHPQLRAVLAGFFALESLNTMIELTPLSDGMTLNISRSLNVRVVNFSFILIQNYSPYNLTFVDISISQSSKLSFSGDPLNYLTFWGMESLRNGMANENELVSVLLGIGNPQTSNILSIGNYSITANLVISGLFLMNNPNNVGIMSCVGYYEPSQSQCVQDCNGHVVNFNISNFQLKYCLTNTSNHSSNNQSYVSNNLADMQNYLPVGCSSVFVQSDASIVCLLCSQGYRMYYNSCVCDYGYYQSVNGCSQCKGYLCQVNTTNSVSLGSTVGSVVGMTVNIVLPSNVMHLHDCADQFEINAIVNGISYSTVAQYDVNSLTFTAVFSNITTGSLYNVSIATNGSSDDDLFHLSGYVTFLWGFNVQLNVSSPLSPQQVIQSIAPVFTNTDKSVPVILAVAFFLGDKINTLSMFQTVSLIYLVNFIPIDSQYSSLLQVLSQIFIFQPSPLFRVFGNSSLVQIPYINTSMIGYNPLIENYTSGQLFISLSFNNVIALVVQIALMVGCIKLLKRIFNQSINKVSPKKRECLDLKRSKVDLFGKIKWISEPLVRECASLRYKVYIYLCKMDEKKWIGITSMLMMQLLSVSFFIFYQFTLPLYGGWMIASRMCCWMCLLLILAYPMLVMRYEPLYVLKCIGVIYKRRNYTTQTLWMCFIFVYFENMVYSLIVVCGESAVEVLVGILLIQVGKLIYFKGMIKTLEIAKILSIALFFLVILVGYLIPSNMTGSMTEITVGVLLGVIIVEIVKLFRGIVVFVLGLFKEKPEEPKIQQKKDESNDNPILEHYTKKQKHQQEQRKIDNDKENNIIKIIPQEVVNIKDIDFKNQNPPLYSQYRSRAFRRRMLREIN